MPTQNIGNTDRTIRLSLGMALIAFSATGHIGAWGYLGIVPVLTAAISWCPLYTVLGWRTNAGRKH